MKKNLLFLCLLLLATSCATQKQTVLIPDPSSSVGSRQGAVSSNPPAGSVQPAGEVAPPVYYDGNDEPVVSGVFLYSEEQQQTN
ncbi:MAG: hypothetical protein LBB31_04155 [Prevotellaceae bacterium]|jgi:hypothetical protein|nr:hypothetical protein [Prevotellaceae bacterium]